MKKILWLTILCCFFASSFALNMTNGVITNISTSTTLYDPGGTGNYANNLNVKHVFYPATAGQYVKVTFSAFDTESNYDSLYVYNGTNICSATRLGAFTGSSIPADIISSSPDGALTFVFISDGSTQKTGFIAALTQQTTIGSTAFSPCGLNMITGGANTIGSTINFYDPGGAGGSGTGATAGNYANSLNVTHTICPLTAGQYVNVSFSAFATQSATDFLYVYNGNSPCPATLLGTFSGSTIPANITSSAPNGCLTFVFTSNGSTRGAGFAATLTQQATAGGTAYSSCISNDDCANATLLTSGTSCVTTAGTTLYATQSQVGCAGTADDDVWYKFVATNTTHTVTFSGTTGTSTDIVHQVFSGSCGALTSIGCYDYPDNSTYTSLTVGNTYYIRVYSYYSGDNTQFNVCVTNPLPAPSNDNCSGAIALTPNTSCIATAGYTNSATQSQTGCTGTADDDVWYSFTATNTSHTVGVTNIGGTSSNIVTEVFTGSCGSLTQVSGTCSDNDNGQVLTGLTVGTTYYVRIYTYSSGVNSQFDICISPPPPDCPDATKLCTDGSTLTFNTTQGTTPSSNDYGCLVTFPRPAWFYIEIDQPGNITYTLNGYNNSGALVDNDYALWGPYSNLAAAQAACGTLPTPIECSYSISATETIPIPTSTIGQVYLLLVTGYSTSSNHFTLQQTSGTGTTNCSSVVGACDISNVALSSITSCNNNSTTSNSTDDYYTATVTITFANKPTTGTLALTGAGIHSGTYSVAVASTTSATTHVFTNVKIKADGVAASLVASFSALSACSMTKTFTAVTSCSACLTPPSVDIGPASSNTCGTIAASFTASVTNGPANLSASGTGTLSTSVLANGSSTFTYTPSAGDAGTTVTITAAVPDPDGIGPCASASDAITLVVNALNTANAGVAQTICAGSPFTLAGSIGGSATSGTWSASSGTFSSSSSLTSTYTPSIASGTVVLTLTATGACPDVNSTVTFTVHDCCPTSVIPTNYTANVCSGATTSTYTTLAAADIVINGAVVLNTDYTIQWFRYADYTGSVPTTLTNSGTCNPIVVPLYAKVVCTHTGIIYNGGTALITIYPAPIAPTLIKNDNSCDYSLKLNCPNIESSTYNTLGQLPGAAAATANIIVTNLGGCSTTFTGIAYPTCNPCATTIVTANPSCCDPSTNQYSVEVVISYANAVGGQPISVTIGTTTVTGITPIKGASGIAVLTINGLNSDGAAHSVSAQVGSGCVAPAGSYTAPASCGSCAPTNAGTIQN